MSNPVVREQDLGNGLYITVYENGNVLIAIEDDGLYTEVVADINQLRAVLKPSWNITTYDSVDYSKGPWK